MVDESASRVEKGAASSPSQRYHVSFFRPATPHARANMKMIISMVLVWAVGVFGFQVALMLLNKRVPEPTLAEFERTWPDVVDGVGVAPEAKRTFARSMLMVLGKNIAVGDADKAVLKEALSWATYDLLSAEDGDALNERVEALAKLQSAAERVGAAPVAAAEVAGHQEQIRTLAAGGLGLEDSGFDSLMADLLPFSLVAADAAKVSERSRQELPGIMQKYLVHNRNVLTDTKFIGFPFHYWYTAQFLLIMFVGLCCVYAYMTDRLHRRYGLVEE